MKFICEKCKTKYSIADKKVKGKVLKIRCKNCSNIITVREQRKKKKGAAGKAKRAGKKTSPGEGGALSRALDGALRDTGGSADSGGAGHLQLAPVASLDQSMEERAEAESEFLDVKTQFSAPPDFAALTADGGADDEWYLAVEGNQFGPMDFNEITSRIKRGEAAIDAFVWRDGYEDWRDLESIKELQPYIPKHPPPPPKGKSGLLSIASQVPDDEAASPAPAVASHGLEPTPAASALPAPVVAAPEVLPPDGPAPLGPPSAAEAPPVAEETHAEVSALAAEAMEPAAGTPLPSMDVNMELTPYGEPMPKPAPTPAEEPKEDSKVAAIIPPPAAEEPKEDSKVAAIALLGGAGAAAAPAPVAAPPTPMVMKLAAAGGIIAAITGVVMVIYFIFIDGPKTVERNPVAVAQVKPKQVAPPTRVAAVNEEEQDEVVIEFPAEEVERSQTKERTVKKAVAKVAPVKPKEPALTEEQKRLKRLYGGASGAAAKGPAELPSAIPSARKKKRGPSRRISAAEIGNLQRRYKKALKACYERALKRDNSLVEVKAEVQVTIGDSGMVKRVRVTNVDSRELKVCLSRVVNRWPFPAVGEQTVAFPIIFRGS